jgi:hypothetical protein
MVDADTDGYPSTTTQTAGDTSPGGTYVRRNTLNSISFADVNDGDGDVYRNVDCYTDSDDDGYEQNGTTTSLESGAACPAGFIETPTAGADCNDDCSTCYPGSTSYTTSVDGLDQDCDSTIDENHGTSPKTCSSVSGGTSIMKSMMTTRCEVYCALGGSVSCDNQGQSATSELSWDWASCNIPSSETWYGAQTVCDIREGGGDSATCTCTPQYR